MQPNDITFFQRFQNDILAGRKPSLFAMPLSPTLKQAMCYAWGDSKMMVILHYRSDRNVNGDAGYAERKHAQQENMSLDELKRVIAEIYPKQTQFYVIDFKCL